MIREAVVQGRFYPNEKSQIFQQIKAIEEAKRYPDHAGVYQDTIGAVIPHAGHVYSGYQTLPFFRLLKERKELPETFIILNPNHTGMGPEVALDPHIKWKNAIGTVNLDRELSNLLSFPEDDLAQKNEHSAEVIIPYIQYYFIDHPFMILPVCIKRQTTDHAIQLARELLIAKNMLSRKVMVIASSDFSHFVTPEKGLRNDQIVLDQIDAKDIVALEDTITTNQISVCGYGPIMTLMAYAAGIDPSYKTTILARGHSGEVYPSRDVVDYISILFYR